MPIEEVRYIFEVWNAQEAGIMITINYTTARNNLKRYMDHVRDNCEPVIITAKGGNSVLMSEEEYNNLMENLYIMSNPELMEKIRLGIEDIAQGKGIQKSFEELKAMEEGQ